MYMWVLYIMHVYVDVHACIELAAKIMRFSGKKYNFATVCDNHTPEA